MKNGDEARAGYTEDEINKVYSDFTRAMEREILDGLNDCDPFQEVFCISLCGEYVEPHVFTEYWEDKPQVEQDIWMILANEQRTAAELAGLTPDEIAAIAHGEDFEHEYDWYIGVGQIDHYGSVEFNPYYWYPYPA